MGRSRAPVPRDPFDPDYTRGLYCDAIAPIVEHYFRPRLRGAGRIPHTGPLILAANHSGNAFPYDGMVLDYLLWRRDGLRRERKFRTMYEPELSVRWWMRPFGIDNLWRRAGGVDQTFDNFERLVARGDRTVYFPEGVPGIGKGFHRRYRLQPFHTSFVLVAARHGVPVHPVYIVNAEWCLPFSFTLRPLDALMRKVFHVPFLPLPAAPLGMLWPWAWYVSLPARMVFTVGEPLDVRQMLAEEGCADPSAPDRAALRRVADRVRDLMQQELRRQVQRHGRRPFQLRSLRRSFGRAWAAGHLSRIVPIGWPAAFVRYHRSRERPAPRGRLHAWARDWDLLGFFLPAGWPLLSLARAFRRPPYGFRGLDPQERRRREGSFVWRLRDQPLPDRGAPPGTPAETMDDGELQAGSGQR
jgi:1-acyl-sn-glycerol-3-phosphate acyltransferase